MKNVLITGATGFIGSYLVEEFAKDNLVIGFMRPGSKSVKRMEDHARPWNKTYIEHDIRKPFNYNHKIDIILHAGGNPSSESSFYDPYSMVMDNIVGTANVLEFARQNDIKRVVYYGAAESYGPAKDIERGTIESDAYYSLTPYAACKSAGSELCMAYSNSYGIKVSVLNIANTFGEKCQTNRFPIIVLKKLIENKPITINKGSDGSIGGRRWFHAEDVALQTRYILDNQESLNDVWNLAGKDFIDNLTFANMIADAYGQSLKVKYDTVKRSGHESFMSLSPKKLYDFGWKDPYTINERIKQMVEWYKEKYVENYRWIYD
mgnify:FL=1|tara:strand:+ start:493 stop:1452 length:960 start_codon:yes stop_codon:yes gene_type:complete